MPRFHHAGIRGQFVTDTYHYLLGMRWVTFFLAIAGIYVGFNLLFATLYLLGGDCINADRPGRFLDAFAFSVQTLSSIGYGALHPTTVYAQVIAIFEAFCGWMLMATNTGVVFAKVSRPSARVGFSDRILVTSMGGVPVLMFRMSNLRRSQVINARVQVTGLFDENHVEGHNIRRLYDLKLQRDQTPAFSLTWMVMHEIDEDSPLWGLQNDEWPDGLRGVLVNFVGLDDTLAQTVSAQWMYRQQHFLHGHRFADMLETNEDRSMTLHHTRLHDVVPIESPSPRL